MPNPWDNDPIVGKVAGPVYGAPPKVEPFAAEDQQFQRDAAARSAAEFAYRRERDAKQDEKDAIKAATPPKDPKVTEGERAAAGYYRRALNAHDQYGEGVLPRGAIAQTAIDMLPSSWENSINSPERREAQNYADEFIRAKLRKESGAAIPTDEMAREYRVYFPVPGDEAADLQRKAELRQEAIEALRIGAGSEADTATAGLGKANDEPTAPPPAVGEQIYSGGQPQGVELSDGGTQRIDDPVLAGVNAKINGMLKSGASGTEIANYLKKVGIPLNQVPNFREVLEFRRKNPGFKGDYTVNIDDKLVPMSGFRSMVADGANSPLAAGIVAGADTLTGGRLDNIVGAGGGNAEVANMGINALRDQNPMSSFAGDVAGGLGVYGIGRGAMSAAGRSAAPATATFAPRAIAGDAAMGGYIASGSDGTDIFSATNALKGAVAGIGGGMVGRGAINTVGRAISPTGGQLAPAYAEGVQPTIGQRMGGVADRAEQAFTSVPITGGIQRGARNKAVDQWQAGGFNKALREIGTQLPQGTQKGTAAHAFMQRAFNHAYDKARSGLTFRRDPEFDKEFTELAQNEVSTLGADGQRIFKSFVDRGSNLLSVRGGTLSGNEYKNMVSRIESKVRGLRKNPSGDTELADALEGLALALDRGARRHSTQEAVKAIDDADRGYVMAVLLEEASRKAGTEMGEYTGKNLESAIRANSGRRSRRALRGEAPMQDYAAAGVRLGNNVPDSGTAERIMTGGATLGGMAGLAKFVDPIALTPWFADTLLNIPGGKQAVNLLMSPNRTSLDPARRKLMERAYLGGLIAAPAAQMVQE